MQKLAELLYVKDTTVFELVHHTFYERDFVFFGKLALHLGQVLGCTKEESLRFGKNSELLYLSSLLHFSLTEETDTPDSLRAEKQMPVLLGDLLYGHFISDIAKGTRPENLAICIRYLREFNARSIDDLEKRTTFTVDDMVLLLTEKTAEIMSTYYGVPYQPICDAAVDFFNTQWNHAKGAPIGTLTALEDLLHNEFGQGAMVC